ncbi:MAG: hypothetical protein GY859_38860 [Desulfobacterales bacterium]|nr:hypothetical protein [Desulfobacterales bacterium]
MQKHELKTGLLILIMAWMVFPLASDAASAAEGPDFKVILGDWIRSDGGYLVRVRDILPDGSVDAEYFNPKKINVAEANVTSWKGSVKLFVQLRDKGYPGSSYTLYYLADKDVLAGHYFQARIKRTYEVYFLRKTDK